MLWLGRLGTRARHGLFLAVEPAALDLPGKSVHVADKMSIGIAGTHAPAATVCVNGVVTPFFGIAVSTQIDHIAAGEVVGVATAVAMEPIAITKAFGGTVVGSLSEERHDWHSRVKIVLYVLWPARRLAVGGLVFVNKVY